MNFDVLDKEMREYEQSLDQVIPSDLYMAARLDGRSFTRLTKDICQFEAPFDIRFRDMMIHTVKNLMDCGFRVIYGFTQSDEISLLFHSQENTFGRKVRKYNSTLAGAASAAFSLQLGQQAVFDCRMIPLPTIERVQDYFLWRQEDARRNALNSHCYWILRKEGMSAQEATKDLDCRTTENKMEFLACHDVPFDTLPSWQKRGVGIRHTEYEKIGYNPKKREHVITTRREISVEYELPIQDEYASFIKSILVDE